jgi:hypothetical protein
MLRQFLKASLEAIVLKIFIGDKIYIQKEVPRKRDVGSGTCLAET